MPREYGLDSTSLPRDLDIFRLEDAVTHIVASERFVEAALRLDSCDLIIKELRSAEPDDVSGALPLH
jgi:hypothetical protein